MNFVEVMSAIKKDKKAIRRCIWGGAIVFKNLFVRVS